jgi:hypothetical protein
MRHQLAFLLALAITSCGCSAPTEEAQGNEPEAYRGLYTADGEPLVAPEPDGELATLAQGDIGTLRQAIYLDSGYGSESGNTSRCVLPWSGGKCNVPRGKSLLVAIRMLEDGCSGTWWENRAIDAVLEMNDFLSLHDFFLTIAITPQEIASANVAMKCIPEAPGLAATFPFSVQCTGSSPKKVCKENSWQITVGGNLLVNLFSGPLGAGKTQTQKDRLTKNLLRHEIGHVAGLGHEPMGQGSNLMAGIVDNSSNWWNANMVPTAFEGSLIGTYNPDGNTPR